MMQTKQLQLIARQQALEFVREVRDVCEQMIHRMESEMDVDIHDESECQTDLIQPSWQEI